MSLMTLLQNIAGIHVPHQTASDGAQYAVSTKAPTKHDNVTGNDVNLKKEDKQVAIYNYKQHALHSYSCQCIKHLGIL